MENENKPTDGNSTFTWIDGIILSVIISLSFGVIFLMACDCIADKVYTKCQVVAGALSLAIFALLSVEKIWEKSDKRWKPHQSIRIGSFALAAVLFAFVTWQEVLQDADTKEKIDESKNEIINQGNATQKEIDESKNEIIEQGRATQKEIDATKKEVLEQAFATRKEIDATRKEIIEQGRATKNEIIEQGNATKNEILEQGRATQKEIDATKKEVLEQAFATRKEIDATRKEIIDSVKLELKNYQEQLLKEVKVSHEIMKESRGDTSSQKKDPKPQNGG